MRGLPVPDRFTTIVLSPATLRVPVPPFMPTPMELPPGSMVPPPLNVSWWVADMPLTAKPAFVRHEHLASALGSEMSSVSRLVH